MLTNCSPSVIVGTVAGGWFGFELGALLAQQIPEQGLSLICRNTLGGAISGAIGAAIGTDIAHRIQ